MGSPKALRSAKAGRVWLLPGPVSGPFPLPPAAPDQGYPSVSLIRGPQRARQKDHGQQKKNEGDKGPGDQVQASPRLTKDTQSLLPLFATTNALSPCVLHLLLSQVNHKLPVPVLRPPHGDHKLEPTCPPPARNKRSRPLHHHHYHQYHHDYFTTTTTISFTTTSSFLIILW